MRCRLYVDGLEFLLVVSEADLVCTYTKANPGALVVPLTELNSHIFAKMGLPARQKAFWMRQANGDRLLMQFVLPFLLFTLKTP